jgi:addiction module RelB/DinJ family antitoxin
MGLMPATLRAPRLRLNDRVLQDHFARHRQMALVSGPRQVGKTMKQSVVRARIANDLKAEASAVLASCGLGLSDVVRIFPGQVVKQGGLPFPVRARHVVSGGQLWKMKHAAQQRDRKLAANEDVSAGEMLLISPDRMRNTQIAWPVIE